MTRRSTGLDYSSGCCPFSVWVGGPFSACLGPPSVSLTKLGHIVQRRRTYRVRTEVEAMLVSPTGAFGSGRGRLGR